MTQQEHDKAPDSDTTPPPAATRVAAHSESDLAALIERQRSERGIVEKQPERVLPWNRVVPLPPPKTEEEIAEEDRRHQERAAHEETYRRKNAWLAFCEDRGSRYADCRLGNYECASEAQRAVVSDLTRYGQDMRLHLHRSEGVVLYGPSGTGKDHLLTGLAYMAIAEHGLSVKWRSGMQIFSEIRDRMETHETEYAYVHSFKSPDVLILSDPLPPMGPLTQFQSVKLYEILSSRYDNGKVTWITINVKDGAEAAERLGTAVYDRMRHDATARFCNWPSYRKAK
jgi:DNA replication protein DnaC